MDAGDNGSAAPRELPPHADGVIVGVDRSLAFELAGCYPDAARIFVVHGADEIHLPPPAPGVVTATVALNDRFAALAAASIGAGEVVRLRQPVDLRRFSPRGIPAACPGRVLLLSLVIFVLITIGGSLGGELTYDYGFNVETAGDSPVWAKSELDVMPDGSTRGGPTPVQPG